MLMHSTNWKELIDQELKYQNESWTDIVKSTLSQEQLNVLFNSSFGMAEGVPFTIWTHKRVYFPVQYDGAEWCESVPRDPCDEITYHIGGG